MSVYYVENNAASTFDLYNKRIIYRWKLINQGYNNIVNFNFGEKFLYGRVTRTYEPMAVKGNNIMKAFPDAAASATNVRAINFVVDAFEKMSQQFTKCAQMGKIYTNDPYLSNLTVYKAYTDPVQLYNNFLTERMNRIALRFKNERIRVKNFDDFILKLIPFLQEENIRSVPFTQPAFMKSRYCPINASGLAVEIADLDPANDDAKINQLINSKNWPFFVNACNNYGFMIDQFVPWRIVADIGSSTLIQEYANKYGINSTNQLFSLYYKQIESSYFLSFKYYLLNFYNQVKTKNYTVQEECQGITINTIITPESYTKEKFTNRYSEMYFLDLYFKIRFMEEESSFEASEGTNLMNDCLQLYTTRGLVASLRNFERIINKPFDYRGSLSYISRHIEAVRDEEGP